MTQASNFLLASVNEHAGNGGMSFYTISLLFFAYLGITTIVLRTFQYLKERDIKRYK